MVEFRLPDIGEGLAEAELITWSVKPGDTVAEGQELATISTDKVNVDLPSPTAGIILELCCQPGQIIPVGTVLVRIDNGKPSTESQSPPVAVEFAETVRVDSTATSSHQPASGPVKAAPITRRLATELGVDLEQITGTGPGGQILNRDLESAATAIDSPPPTRRMKLTGARLAASRRIAQSSRTLATSTLSFEVPADAILAACFDSDGERVGPLAVALACVVRSLQAHPHFNACIDQPRNELLMYDAVHLGLAINTDEGLMVPVLKHVEQLGLIDLSHAIDTLKAKARSGKLELQDMSGSTFTVSSTGGLEQVSLLATTPIINLPNVATLWLSRITTRPRVLEGKLEAGPMMSLSLTFDHRYLHGADGVAFINSLGESFACPIA